MDLLGYKWNKGNSDFEITVVERINDLQHYEIMYKDAFDVRCARTEFNEELFGNCEHETDECTDFYFCMVEETDKGVIIPQSPVTEVLENTNPVIEGMENTIPAIENKENEVVPEVLYRKNIIHLLVNKSGCFRFTADNQKYLNTEKLKTEAEAEYEKMLIAFAGLIGDNAKGENRVVRKNGTVAIEHLTEQEITAEKIAVLKQQLAITADKVIDNQECIHCGVECMHDPQELHRERQALRNEINQLEMQL